MNVDSTSATCRRRALHFTLQPGQCLEGIKPALIFLPRTFLVCINVMLDSHLSPAPSTGLGTYHAYTHGAQHVVEATVCRLFWSTVLPQHAIQLRLRNNEAPSTRNLNPEPKPVQKRPLPKWRNIHVQYNGPPCNSDNYV